MGVEEADGSLCLIRMLLHDNVLNKSLIDSHFAEHQSVPTGQVLNERMLGFRFFFSIIFFLQLLHLKFHLKLIKIAAFMEIPVNENSRFEFYSLDLRVGSNSLFRKMQIKYVLMVRRINY